MSLITFPLDLTSYSADSLGAWFAARSRGVLADEGHYDVTANGGMSVTVGPGVAWLKMEEHWGVVVRNSVPTVLAVQVADNTRPRVDAVCLQLDKVANQSQLIIKQGTPAASPVPAPLVRDNQVDEIYLALITVPAGAATVQAIHIADQRLNESFCGVTVDGTRVPTQGLQDQFDDWFANLQATLSGDVVGNLLIEIERVEGDLSDDIERIEEKLLHTMQTTQQHLRSLTPKELAVTILSSGQFRPADHGLVGETVDVYMVGGGGGSGSNGGQAGGGGGGGHCLLLRNVLLELDAYSIIVGSGGTSANTGTAGGTTSGFGQSAPGGLGGGGIRGGAGGSGGGGVAGVNVSTGVGGSFGGSGNSDGGRGSGNAEFSPWNPYDWIAYGCGGGGHLAAGGGAGGTGGPNSENASGLGGGGGGGVTTTRRGGDGGLGGGGGGAHGASTAAAGGRGGNGLVYIYAKPRADLMAMEMGEALTAAFSGNLSVAEILECDVKMKEYAFRVAVMKAGVCIDSAVFCDMAVADEFLAAGVWPEAGAVARLPEGFGVGDLLGDGGWVKRAGENAEALW